MLKRLLVAMVAILVLFVLVGAAGAAWLVYQPVKADVVVYQRYQAALAAHPAFTWLLTRAYNAYARITRANTLHYVVHEAAARFAAITGHMHAAGVQAQRAAFHRPEHGGAIISLLVEVGHGLARLWQRLI